MCNYDTHETGTLGSGKVSPGNQDPLRVSELAKVRPPSHAERAEHLVGCADALEIFGQFSIALDSFSQKHCGTI